MNSGDLNTYKHVKISKSNIFTITMLSLHSICSESKKQFKHLFQAYNIKKASNFKATFISKENIYETNYCTSDKLTLLILIILKDNKLECRT